MLVPRAHDLQLHGSGADFMFRGYSRFSAAALESLGMRYLGWPEHIPSCLLSAADKTAQCEAYEQTISSLQAQLRAAGMFPHHGESSLLGRLQGQLQRSLAGVTEDCEVAGMQLMAFPRGQVLSARSIVALMLLFFPRNLSERCSSVQQW